MAKGVSCGGHNLVQKDVATKNSLGVTLVVGS